MHESINRERETESYEVLLHCNSSTRIILKNQHNTTLVVDEGWVDNVDDAQENANSLDSRSHSPPSANSMAFPGICSPLISVHT